MKFIKLTVLRVIAKNIVTENYELEDEGYAFINIEKIIYIEPTEAHLAPSGRKWNRSIETIYQTISRLSIGESNCVYVRETPEEIMKMIKEEKNE